MNGRKDGEEGKVEEGRMKEGKMVEKGEPLFAGNADEGRKEIWTEGKMGEGKMEEEKMKKGKMKEGRWRKGGRKVGR
jgi:hypothetical protein